MMKNTRRVTPKIMIGKAIRRLPIRRKRLFTVFPLSYSSGWGRCPAIDMPIYLLLIVTKK